jgi:ubiquitin-like protein ATG12
MGMKFTYINAAFAPAPDDTVGNLYKVNDTPTSQQGQGADSSQCFGTEGHLIVNYRSVELSAVIR